jgi:hypothetical protein
LDNAEQTELKPVKTSLKNGTTVELKQSSAQGFFHWLGTKEGRDAQYTNPLTLKMVDVQSLGSYSFPDSSLGASLIFDTAFRNQVMLLFVFGYLFF